MSRNRSSESEDSGSPHPSMKELRSSQDKRRKLIEETRLSIDNTESIVNSLFSPKVGHADNSFTSNKNKSRQRRSHSRDLSRRGELRTRSKGPIPLSNLGSPRKEIPEFQYRNAHHDLSEGEQTSDDDTLNFDTSPILPTSPRVPNFERHSSANGRDRDHSPNLLSRAAERLHAILVKVNEVSSGHSESERKSRRNFKNQFLNTSALNKANIAKTLDELSEQLQRDIGSLIKYKSKDRTNINDIRMESDSLKLQLQNSLQIQRTLEETVNSLSKEKKWLEAEVKNLTLKMVPLMSSNRPSTGPSPHPRNCPNNNFARTPAPSASVESSHFSEYPVAPSSTYSKASLLSHSEDGTEYDNVSEICHPRDELDSITSYVRKKSKDVGRLEGELHQYREATQSLERRICHLSKEYQVTLSDFGDIVESYRELEAERDNYECMLKLILKERSSSESNLPALLDDIIKQLSSSSAQNSQEVCEDDNGNLIDTAQFNQFSSKHFLQGVLQAIQGQNIQMKEEMIRVREELNEIEGKKNSLQTNNEALVEKVQELKKELENKDQTDDEKRKELEDRFENLEKYLQDSLSEKAELQKTLDGKQEEMQRLEKLIEKYKKELEEQSERLLEFQNINESLEVEVKEFKNEIELLNENITSLKTGLRDEAGIWRERAEAVAQELASSKDHCRWLESQIEKLNAQLVNAHERIKLHEKDKAILAQKVLSADEERRTLDRKILEIKSIMHGDSVYRQALAQRNEALQLKIQRMEMQSQTPSWMQVNAGSQADISQEQASCTGICASLPGHSQSKEFHASNSHITAIIDGSIGDAAALVNHVGKARPTSRENPNFPNVHRTVVYNPQRRHHTRSGNKSSASHPRAAHLCLQQVSLHNPNDLCYKEK